MTWNFTEIQVNTNPFYIIQDHVTPDVSSMLVLTLFTILLIIASISILISGQRGSQMILIKWQHKVLKTHFPFMASFHYFSYLIYIIFHRNTESREVR